MKKRVTLFLSLMVGLTVVAFSLMGAASPAVQSKAMSGSPHLFFKSGARGGPLARSNNLSYHGGPVMEGTANVYAIYWQPTNNVSTNYHSLINRYFGDIGGSSLYAMQHQYTQSGGAFASNARLAGTFTDTSAYPESPLLDSDIQNEVTHAQQANGWSSSNDNIFFVFTQRNEDLCIDSSLSQCASNTFCAYHFFFGTNTIYAAMPYAASFSCNPGSSPNNDEADQTINVTSHEQMEAADDPLTNAWFDRSGNEIGDKCAWQFGPRTNGADVNFNGHPYILQKEWNNRIGGCSLTA
ncbi:MAG TPA: hypothetical protein VKR06_10775 [Ktedonosporobacter sp.]|nr:hypothetical protein [Ktedonosporobacter sp.]